MSGKIQPVQGGVSLSSSLIICALKGIPIGIWQCTNNYWWRQRNPPWTGWLFPDIFHRRYVYEDEWKIRYQKFGEKAIAAMLKEFKQLDHGGMSRKKYIFGHVDPDKITKNKKKA